MGMHALDRGVSDHTLLLLDTDAQAFTGNGKQFKLELSWFQRDDFYDRVVEIWNRPVRGNNPVQKWNNKLSALHRHLRGWAANKVGLYKTQKQSLQATINQLDVEAEARHLSEVEQNDLALAREHLAQLLREEEIKYFQRAKVKDVLLGDNNTRYFQLVANGKHRRKLIFSLDQAEGKIDGQQNLKNYITNFYKELFGPPEESLYALDSSKFGDIPQVTREENDFLTSPFTEKEVREMLFLQWNVTRHLAQMVSQLSSIKSFGTP